MKCAHCKRDMKSTRPFITEVIMMDVIKRFTTNLCRTCWRKRLAELRKSVAKR